jgi:hypothetical protein
MTTYKVILANGQTITLEAPGTYGVDQAGWLQFPAAAGQGDPPVQQAQLLASFPPGWLGVYAITMETGDSSD